MPGDSPEQNTDQAVYKLSLAVTNLADIVGSLRGDVSRVALVVEQLTVRCGSLEKTVNDLEEHLFTGNGQPSITQQLTAVKTQVEGLVNDLREFDQTRVSEHRLKNSEQLFTTKLDYVTKLMEDVQKAQAKLEEQRQTDRSNKEMSRLQVLVAIVGGVLGLLSAGITAIATYLSTK